MTTTATVLKLVSTDPVYPKLELVETLTLTIELPKSLMRQFHKTAGSYGATPAVFIQNLLQYELEKELGRTEERR